MSRRALLNRAAAAMSAIADMNARHLVRTKKHLAEEAELRADAAALTALADVELPQETVSAIREWLDGPDGSTVELADDAIVKLTDAKGRPFARMTAGLLRSLIGDEPCGEPSTCPAKCQGGCRVCASPARLSGSAA